MPHALRLARVDTRSLASQGAAPGRLQPLPSHKIARPLPDPGSDWCPQYDHQHGKLGGLTVFGTVGVSIGGLVSFYGTKILPKSLWGSLESIKSVHRNGGEWVWFMAMMCIYLGIQPNDLERPVSQDRAHRHRHSTTISSTASVSLFRL